MDNFSVADRGESLADQAYRQLAAGILEGRYSPGDRVNIRVLAQLMGVSQTPVREAVTRLLSEGILCTVGRAIEVPLVNRKDLDEIFQLRLMLEGELAEKAADFITPAILAEETQTQSALDQAIATQNYKESLKLNVKFHFTLYRAAQQPIHLQLVEKLWLLIGPSMNMMYPALASMRSTHHASILEAMKTQDPQALRAAVQADIHTALETIRSLHAIMETKLLAATNPPPPPRRPVGRPRKVTTD